jgi:formylglycine-generating enzyme required for sulfatase activity
MPDPLDPITVRVSDFFIDVTETTKAEYAKFLEDTGYRPPYVDEGWAEEGWDWESSAVPRDTADHPVVLVSWWDARAYCEWAHKRLPTEAEWQLAVLGPADDEWTFPWGNTYDAMKLNHGRMEEPNFDDSDGWARTSPVGSFPSGASRWGLLDAFGNAWEWTADIREPSWDRVLGERDGDVIVNPHTDTVGLYAAVRGSAYFFDIRPNPAAERNGFLLELRRKTSGFRCARDP